MQYVFLIATFTLIFSSTIISDAQQISNRIVGGQNAFLGQFPYQVSWCVGDLWYCQIFCGGSIYDENTIITAAHCCHGIVHNMAIHGITWDWVRIIAGDVNNQWIQGSEQPRKAQCFKISQKVSFYNITSKVSASYAYFPKKNLFSRQKLSIRKNSKLWRENSN